MILDITLGIVLAFIILACLPFAVVAGLAIGAVALVIGAIVLVFWLLGSALGVDPGALVGMALIVGFVGLCVWTVVDATRLTLALRRAKKKTSSTIITY